MPFYPIPQKTEQSSSSLPDWSKRAIPTLCRTLKSPGEILKIPMSERALHQSNQDTWEWKVGPGHFKGSPFFGGEALGEEAREAQ